MQQFEDKNLDIFEELLEASGELNVTYFPKKSWGHATKLIADAGNNLGYVVEPIPKFINFEKYLKRVWFANGIHHHYASDKFQPEFTQEWFVAACAEAGVTYDEAILPVIFDPTVMPKSLSLEGEDLLLASANNYYEGVTQKEAEAYYEAHKDNSAEPLWIGLNSKLVKENGKVVERVYKVGGMYSAALEKVVEHLEKALPFAENEQQRLVIEKMIEFNKTGDLKAFNESLSAVVKYKAATKRFMSDFHIKTNSGLSMYLPFTTGRDYLHSFYKTLEWNQAVGLIQ